MRLTWKDLFATAAVGTAVVACAAHLNGSTTWLLDSTRGTTALVFGLGMLGCIAGSAPQLYVGPGASRAAGTLAGLLGAVALLGAVVALVTGGSAWLVLLVGAEVALWLLATARHALAVAPARPAEPPAARDRALHR